jgi:hypothetical protein
VEDEKKDISKEFPAAYYRAISKSPHLVLLFILDAQFFRVLIQT